MIFWEFLHPQILQETPRFFTAIAEWMAVFVFLKIYKTRGDEERYIFRSIISFIVLQCIQFIAGVLPIAFWIFTMILAVGIIYVSFYWILDIKPKDCGVLTVHAFVLAEFVASFYKQLFVWAVMFGLNNSFVLSFLVMLVVYAGTFLVYYFSEKRTVLTEQKLNITTKELLSVITTGVVAFGMSNISFVTSRTPFSASDSILYVRTLVDFGGVLMLTTQMSRINELAVRQESDAINLLFQKQYEQYKQAIDNSENLRKEMHDMKHYVIALKNEDDPVKRAAVLEDMEQAIAIQEAFMNTGNKVLDVILTTKSMQCEKKNIHLSAMTDGDVLSDIHVKDLCSLFGNILDNAIEATQQVENVEKRIISLSVRKRNQFIVVECENCCEGVEVRLKDAHSLKTTKKDNVHHGFGLKSIAQVAEKYDGGINCFFENGWFKIKVLLSV